MFIPGNHHPDQSAPIFLLFQTQEQTEVLESLKQELATSKQELQIVRGSLETSAQVSITSLPHFPLWLGDCCHPASSPTQQLAKLVPSVLSVCLGE